jgi:hypothetical protein
MLSEVEAGSDTRHHVTCRAVPSWIRRPSHESRLLILTISVSALVLLLLAQLRFPDAIDVGEPALAPLDRLAASPSYDQLASSIARVEATIGPSIFVLRLAPATESPPVRLADLLVAPQETTRTIRHVPVLRIGSTTALAAIDGEARIAGIVGPFDPTATATVIGSDPIRRVAALRVSESTSRVPSYVPLNALQAPTYIVAVEGTHAGVTIRPVFLGRGARFTDPRWTEPLVPLGGAPVIPGALIFTLAGQFLGLVVAEGDTLAIASSVDVVETASRLADAGKATPTDAGITVQRLTPGLASATGSPIGVVIADVAPDSAAWGVVNVGDVLVSVDGQIAESPEAVLLSLAARTGGERILLEVVRDRRVARVELVLRNPSAPPSPGNGLTLGDEPGGGARVASVERGSLFEAAGLAPGDLIVRAGQVQAPTSAETRRVLADAEPGAYVVLAVRRNGRQQLLAVETPLPSDESSR